MGRRKHLRRPVVERELFRMRRLLEGREFESEEELDAFLKEATQKLNRGEELPLPEGTPADRAQELIYEAWQMENPQKRVRLAREALKAFPDCADAYVILAEDAARSIEEARDLYAEGVRAGERALGPDFMKENAGHFWGDLRTRGYMRARQGLYQCLWELGDKEEAVRHCEEMLRLNPNDNQGVRYHLAAYLLETRQLGKLDKLFRTYKEESTFWDYTRALFYFMRQEGKKAQRMLSRALEANPFVPAYLLGARSLPDEMPGLYSLGSEEEAVIYVGTYGVCWLREAEAVLWLAATVAEKLAEWAEKTGPSGPARYR